MSVIYDSIRYLHLVAGSAALLLFWVPALSRKGSPLHRTAGKAYLIGMFIVVGSGLPLTVHLYLFTSQIFGIFLGYILVITFTALWTGWRALHAKQGPAAYITPLYRLLAWLNIVSALVVFVLGVYHETLLLMLFSPVGLLGGISALRFMRRPPTDRMYWLYEHFGGMIGSGIAAHIAFGAFGMRQLFPELQLGWAGLLPWLLPLIAGTSAIIWLNRYYRQKHDARLQFTSH